MIHAHLNHLRYRKQDASSAATGEDASADERKGIHTGSAALYGVSFPTFSARYKDMPLRDAILSVTSKEGLGLPPTAVLLSEPVDVAQMTYFRGLTVVGTSGGDDVVTPPVVLVLQGSAMVPYRQRPQLYSSRGAV